MWPEETDNKEDRVFWQCFNCPRTGKCSAGSWKRTTRYSYIPPQVVHANVSRHLQNKHGFKPDEADDIAKEADVHQMTETFDDRAQYRTQLQNQEQAPNPLDANGRPPKVEKPGGDGGPQPKVEKPRIAVLAARRQDRDRPVPDYAKGVKCMAPVESSSESPAPEPRHISIASCRSKAPMPRRVPPPPGVAPPARRSRSPPPPDRVCRSRAPRVRRRSSSPPSYSPSRSAEREEAMARGRSYVIASRDRASSSRSRGSSAQRPASSSHSPSREREPDKETLNLAESIALRTVLKMMHQNPQAGPVQAALSNGPLQLDLSPPTTLRRTDIENALQALQDADGRLKACVHTCMETARALHQHHQQVERGYCKDICAYVSD